MGWLDTVTSQLGGDGLNLNKLIETGLQELISSPQAAQLLAQWLGADAGGGLAKLAQQFGAQGLDSVLQSWLGHGAAEPINTEQLQAVLGNEQVQAMARAVGVDPSQALHILTSLLPQAVKLLNGKAD